MLTAIERVEAALDHLRQGKMVILTDHPDRENEGDFVIAAEKITPALMNFIIRHSSGIVCLSITNAQANKLQLPLMVHPQDNTSAVSTPFTVSIDAKIGITTGVSAADRVRTIQVAIDDASTTEDLVKPGHIFPLQAKIGGVLERAGHTEGAMDLMQLAGLKPAAVLCEIMNADGTMTRGQQLIDLANTHQLILLSIDDLITYRLTRENLIAEEVSARLPTENYGDFQITIVKEKITGGEHVVLSKPKQRAYPTSTLVRIHSSCMTGDLFSSQRCDCYQGLHYALQCLSEEGGVLIYLHQEGRGIGLLNKIKAYALQENGLDTIEANHKLGFPADLRQYYLAASILRNLKLDNIRLMTNNLEKLNDLKKFGIKQVTREAMPVFHNCHNYQYLKVKKEKLKHVIDL
ncbi:MAG TPA: 3,4-dihydroxy-2-butanone-4-phosphate synthase [Gammaproteobacteria bacterium]|jgi:3,4-dihydroxy 2-butanone 4-phosphate synthase/GTP cyclohydrolase II|nr:3,4-dihydroxy-2-butanone-4-phosphate synthase [Gammaproteobacteria bacterium]